MNCVSCNIAIDPRFSHAINTNICPYCGLALVPEDVRGLLSSLKEVMTKMQDFPEYLQDWMLSNFQFIKTDNPMIVSYIPETYLEEIKKIEEIKSFENKKKSKTTIKVKLEDGSVQEQEVMIEKIASDEEASGFAKRAQAMSNSSESLQEKSARIKKMKELILKGGSLGSSDSEDSDESSDDSSSEDYSEHLSDEYSDYSQDSDYGYGEKLPSVVTQMANKFSKTKSKNSDAETLNKLKNVVESNSKKFQSGSGLFSRS